MENFRDYELERDRIMTEMKAVDVMSPEYMNVFKELRSIQDLIAIQKRDERENRRLGIEMKKQELEEEKWKESVVNENRKFEIENRKLDIEEKKLELEAHRLDLENRKKGLPWVEILKTVVFAGVAFAALRYESGGNVFGLDTTKNIMRLNKM